MKPRILVVDDEDVLREAVALMLEMNGYTILNAKNGEEALEILARSEQPVDLVLSDLHMPKMGGIELREKVLSTRPEIRFILTSGTAAEDPIIIQELANKNIGYLPKPSTMRQLLGKIDEVLNFK